MATNSNNNDKNMWNKNQNQDPIANLASLPTQMLNWFGHMGNDIISVWDEDGRAKFTSKSIERLLGYKTSELKGLLWSDLIAEEDILYIKDNFNKNTEKEQLFTINIRHQNGKYIWCECIIGKMKMEHGNSAYYTAVIRDISDKKEFEEMMIRSEKMSIAGQLAAGIAHEIRNPLTAIKGFLQLLQAGVNRKDAYYKIMIEEIEKMESITSELLFISKPLTDHKQNESVLQMVDDVVALLQPEAKLKDIDIIREDAKEASIECDRSQIKQVLINLVKNAIEAMDDPGKIMINIQSSEIYIQVNIIDEGPGIPEEVIHKLGEPFFTTKQNGTGLGLMITKQILERHNAKMEVIQNKNNGSIFRVKFPKKEKVSSYN